MSKPRQQADSISFAEFEGRHVALCVTGGIAAYKAAYLTRELVKCGAEVLVIMSEAARKFVTPMTFETLSQNKVITSTFSRQLEMGAVEHIDLAEWAEVVIVAPATYNFIGKLASGIADDVVSTFMTAVRCPVFIAPAMNEHMWWNPINQSNVRRLKELGYVFLNPERGGLACRWEGDGRLQEPDDILAAVRSYLDHGVPPPATENPGGASPVANGDNAVNDDNAVGGSGGLATGRLNGKKVLVTAGGTHEAIDPVRFIGNRSSGRMGYELAAACGRAGARVSLLSGPSQLPQPENLAAFRKVETAQEMRDVALEWIRDCDVLIMSAAVADFRPAKPFRNKLKRGKDAMELSLEPTPDILAELSKHKRHCYFVGFALESDDLAQEAKRKLKTKNLDLIVANKVGEATGPESRTNQVWIYDREGLVQETPLLEKQAIAEIILGVVSQRLQRPEPQAGAK